MPIRWRDLLDHLNIPWTDKSRYAARGWIAIRCPWCGDDPSTHLGIKEAIGIYHCLRTTGHAGKSPYYLLKALGVPYGEMDQLLDHYSDGEIRPRRQLAERDWRPPETSPFERRWTSFKPAEGSPEALDYLNGRHFWNPRRTAHNYDLRVGFGRWAARLWFPLSYEGKVIGFTGRAMRPRLNPKYMTESADTVLYLPRPAMPDDQTVLLVEGPFDALRLTDAIEDRHPILVAALCGLSITPTKQSQLWALARKIPRFAMTLDSTVAAVDTNRLLAPHSVPHSGGASLLRPRRLPLPLGIGDPGEMTNTQIDEWLRGNQWLVGQRED